MHSVECDMSSCVYVRRRLIASWALWASLGLAGARCIIFLGHNFQFQFAAAAGAGTLPIFSYLDNGEARGSWTWRSRSSRRQATSCSRQQRQSSTACTMQHELGLERRKKSELKLTRNKCMRFTETASRVSSSIPLRCGISVGDSSGSSTYRQRAYRFTQK